MEQLTAQQVVVLLGISENTLNFWYRFKRQNPDNEIAQLLPEYMSEGVRGKRYWKKDDLWKLIEFQKSVPKGRNGIMGTVTQKYCKKENANGKKKSRSKRSGSTNTRGAQRRTR